MAAVGSLTAMPTGAAQGSEVGSTHLVNVPSRAADLSAAALSDRPRNGRIAYVVYVDRRPEVVTIRPSGKGKQRLTHNDIYDSGPEISPSGRRIVFQRGDDSVDLFTMRLDGTDLQRLNSAGGVQPTWSPSGKRIAFACLKGADFEVCTIRRDGRNRQQVTDDDVHNLGIDWASTGRIAYTAVSDSDDAEIYTIRPNGSDIRQVTHNTTDDFTGSFSPSGRRISYLGPRGEIYIKRIARGGTRHQVTHSAAETGYPSWSPNGRRIAYTEMDNTGSDIYTIRVSGEDRNRVTNTKRVEERPDWGVRPRR